MILAFNDQRVRRPEEVQAIVDSSRVGATVRLTIIRDERELVISVTLVDLAQVCVCVCVCDAPVRALLPAGTSWPPVGCVVGGERERGMSRAVREESAERGACHVRFAARRVSRVEGARASAMQCDNVDGHAITTPLARADAASPLVLLTCVSFLPSHRARAARVHALYALAARG